MPANRDRWSRGDVLFLTLLALAHTALWWWANRAEGVWLQVPATDQAHDLRAAILMKRALVSGSPIAMVHAWTNSSPVHTPFVPFVSAVLMLIGGESRLVAEAVLPIATGVWLVATFAVVRRLYDDRTARLTTALMGTFPVFLLYSRTYLFEQPLAAVFACAASALVATDLFVRRSASIAFGILAGLTPLTRGGGFIFLAGPVAIVVAAMWKQPDRAARRTNALIAAVIAAAVAATWYAPNLRAFVSYVYAATYGADAAMRRGAATATLLDTMIYHARWIVTHGPGVPTTVLAAWSCVAAFSVGAWRRPGVVTAALMTAFAIDFILLSTVGQQEGARYFLPLMPLLALAVVRGFLVVPSMPARTAGLIAAALLTMEHLVTFSPLPGLGQTYAQSLADFYELRTTDDFRIGETVDALEHLRLRPGARVATITPPHPYFQANGLQLEAVTRRVDLSFLWSAFVAPNLTNLDRALPPGDVDAVLVRSGGQTGVELTRVVEALCSNNPRVEDSGRRIALGDGSVVALFVKRSS